MSNNYNNFTTPIKSSLPNKGQLKLGPYLLGKKLGQGTFGLVRLGTHIKTGEKVAIKILEKSKILETSDKERVEREIKILKILRHKNIIQLYSVIHSLTSIYLVMEYAEGHELFDYIIKNNRLDEAEACKFYQEIISGIEYLHNLKIVHRDLKPENLLFDYNKNIKIVDFGLSNLYSEKHPLLNTPCGSPCYASPEMLTGEPYLGITSDIWSSGIVLFAMLTGSLPFDDVNDEALYNKICKGKFIMPTYLSDEAKELINGILNVDPNTRYGLKEIKESKWFNMRTPVINDGLLILNYVTPVDDSIVQEIIEKYGGSYEQIYKNIIYNHHNHITTLYYLIMKKRVKKGETFSSDLFSEKFLEYLKDENNLLKKYNYDLFRAYRERVAPYVDNQKFNSNHKKKVNEYPLTQKKLKVSLGDVSNVKSFEKFNLERLHQKRAQQLLDDKNDMLDKTFNANLRKKKYIHLTVDNPNKHKRVISIPKNRNIDTNNNSIKHNKNIIITEYNQTSKPKKRRKISLDIESYKYYTVNTQTNNNYKQTFDNKGYATNRINTRISQNKTKNRHSSTSPHGAKKFFTKLKKPIISNLDYIPNTSENKTTILNDTSSIITGNKIPKENQELYVINEYSSTANATTEYNEKNPFGKKIKPYRQKVNYQAFLNTTMTDEKEKELNTTFEKQKACEITEECISSPRNLSSEELKTNQKLEKYDKKKAEDNYKNNYVQKKKNNKRFKKLEIKQTIQQNERTTTINNTFYNTINNTTLSNTTKANTNKNNNLVIGGYCQKAKKHKKYFHSTEANNRRNQNMPLTVNTAIQSSKGKNLKYDKAAINNISINNVNTYNTNNFYQTYIKGNSASKGKTTKYNELIKLVKPKTAKAKPIKEKPANLNIETNNTATHTNSGNTKNKIGVPSTTSNNNYINNYSTNYNTNITSNYLNTTTGIKLDLSAQKQFKTGKSSNTNSNTNNLRDSIGSSNTNNYTTNYSTTITNNVNSSYNKKKNYNTNPNSSMSSNSNINSSNNMSNMNNNNNSKNKTENKNNQSNNGHFGVISKLQSQEKILHSASEIKLTPSSTTVLIYTKKNKTQLKAEIVNYCLSAGIDCEVINEFTYSCSTQTVEIKIEVMFDFSTKKIYLKIRKEIGNLTGYRDVIKDLLHAIL